MKKFTNIFLIILILFFTCFSFTNFTYAQNNVAATNEAQSTGQITTTVKTTSSTENELFSVTNIINIFLIAVGIVLILLAVAIFTRLK